MRIVFMGSPEFSVGALRALHAAGHDIACVYTQPPRPKGRGHDVEKTAVHKAAEEMGFTVRTPTSLKPDGEVAAFRALGADVAVVAAYGLILRQNILTAPRLGCINIHASLLPRWRGAAPIQRAIEAGDCETGITIMQMDEGLDTGPMLLRGAVPINAMDTGQTIHDALADMGARLIVSVLENSAAYAPVPQPDNGVTYAHKLKKEDGRINWNLSAEVIERTLRAFTPWPGMFFDYNGESIRVHAARVVAGSGVPGTVIELPFVVACGAGALALDVVQRAGKNKQKIDEFCRGFPVKVGNSVQ
jgi:methionyl-tRNA formyltransferase